MVAKDRVSITRSCSSTTAAYVKILMGTVLVTVCGLGTMGKERSWPDAEGKIPDAILDQLLGGADDPKTAFDPNGLWTI